MTNRSKKRNLTRSEIMSRVRGKNTSPEIFVRKTLCALGLGGYRLHRKGLPGKPDICFVRRRKAIFVNGCFWHGHNCTHGRRLPVTNTDYWCAKISGNKRRDIDNAAQLRSLGWSVLTLWECKLKDQKHLSMRLSHFMGDTRTVGRSVKIKQVVSG